MMKQDTKENILRVGADIIHRKGYNHTPIQEILQIAGVPKGSFYFYFKSKEDFGLQVIEYFNEFYAAHAKEILEDPTIASPERIRNFLDGFIELFESLEYTNGCPIGNLAQEMGDLSPVFQEKLRESFKLMTDIYAQVIEEGQRTGNISRNLPAEDIAEFIVSSWHGALIRMKIEQNGGPLKRHREMLFNTVLKSP